MKYMFIDSEFNTDISLWDVSQVTNMSGMFKNSMFNQDISEWNISNKNDITYIFKDSSFHQNVTNWNISEPIQVWNNNGLGSGEQETSIHSFKFPIESDILLFGIPIF